MTSRVRVPLHQQAGRFVSIDPKATEGAVVGVNVLNADGALWVPPVAVAPEVGEPEQTLWELILKVPPNIIALEEASGTGFFTVTGVGTGAFRTIEAVAGETTSANENGVSGNPTIGLADVPNSGTGAFKLITRDAKGRLSGTADGDTDDVSEGGTNLYFTDARARAAVVAASITNGDTTHAPSGDAVFDALARTKGYIDGLLLSWDSTTSISVSSGAAYIEGDGRIVEFPSGLTASSLSLSANTWYHVYGYLNAGTPAIEVVTTAPAAAFSGTARSKTGDTSRRYIGSIRSDGSSNVINFANVLGHVIYRHNFASVARVVSGGTATTATTVSAASFVPPTSTRASIRAVNSGAGGQAVVNCWAGAAFTAYASATSTAVVVFVDIDLNSSQQFEYFVTSTGVANIDVIGYQLER